MTICNLYRLLFSKKHEKAAQCMWVISFHISYSCAYNENICKVADIFDKIKLLSSAISSLLIRTTLHLCLPIHRSCIYETRQKKSPRGSDSNPFGHAEYMQALYKSDERQETC